MGLESLAVFKQRILEEHWLYRLSSYLWSWGVEAVGERRGTQDKWKEQGKTFN